MRATRTLSFMAGLLLLSQAIAAPFSPQQLAALTLKPAAFKPTESGTTNVNTGVKAYAWQWGNLLPPNVELTRLNGNANAWMLNLSSSIYPISKIAPRRQLLATITDPVGDGPISIFMVQSGPFKNQYLEVQQFSDGSRSVALKTRDYATISANGSELQHGGESYIYSYPAGAYLLFKKNFCSTPGASCK